MFGNRFEDVSAAIDAKEKELTDKAEKLAEIQRDLDQKVKNFETEKGQVYKTMELEFKEKLMDATQKLRTEYDEKLSTGLESNYKKLSNSLTTLHEEGNANTKYLEKITLKMMDTMKPVTPPSQQLEYEEE